MWMGGPQSSSQQREGAQSPSVLCVGVGYFLRATAWCLPPSVIRCRDRGFERERAYQHPHNLETHGGPTLAFLLHPQAAPSQQREERKGKTSVFGVPAKCQVMHPGYSCIV